MGGSNLHGMSVSDLWWRVFRAFELRRSRGGLAHPFARCGRTLMPLREVFGLATQYAFVINLAPLLFSEAAPPTLDRGRLRFRM